MFKDNSQFAVSNVNDLINSQDGLPEYLAISYAELRKHSNGDAVSLSETLKRAIANLSNDDTAVEAVEYLDNVVKFLDNFAKDVKIGNADTLFGCYFKKQDDGSVSFTTLSPQFRPEGEGAVPALTAGSLVFHDGSVLSTQAVKKQLPSFITYQIGEYIFFQASDNDTVIKLADLPTKVLYRAIAYKEVETNFGISVIAQATDLSTGESQLVWANKKLAAALSESPGETYFVVDGIDIVSGKTYVNLRVDSNIKMLQSISFSKFATTPSLKSGAATKRVSPSKTQKMLPNQQVAIKSQNRVEVPETPDFNSFDDELVF